VLAKETALTLGQSIRDLFVWDDARSKLNHVGSTLSSSSTGEDNNVLSSPNTSSSKVGLEPCAMSKLSGDRANSLSASNVVCVCRDR